MGIHTPINRTVRWLIVIAVGLSATGCLSFRSEPPTPLPTITPLPTETPTPAFTSTPTPLPTLIPTRTPEPGCAVEWGWMQNSLVITDVDITRMDGLIEGDRIFTIEGRLALEVILEAEEEFAAVEDPARRRALALDKILKSNHVLLLGVKHNAEPFYYFNLHPDCN